MDKTKFVCGICGKTINDLDEYVAHVKECGAKLKAEKDQKALAELNAAINKVKAAKTYYEQCLQEFKEKYPNEYELNFGTPNKASNKDNRTIDSKQKNLNCRVLNEDDFVKFMQNLLGFN